MVGTFDDATGVETVQAPEAALRKVDPEVRVCIGRLSDVGDELVVAECDLDRCADFKDTLFDFGYYRRPEVYGAITGQAGVEVPADVAAALGRGGVDGEGER